MISISIVVAILLVLYLLWSCVIHPAIVSPLARIPNAHFSAPFSPAWMLWNRYKARELRSIHAAHEQHGKVVRLGPNEVSVASVDDGIRIIYSGGFDKDQWYPNQFDNYSVPCAFSMACSKPHATRRRMLSNVYSKSYIQSSPDFEKISHTLMYDRLLPTLRSLDSRHQPVDITDLTFAFAMDSITCFTFGLGHGSDFLNDGEIQTEWLRKYQSRRPYSFWDGELPGVKAALMRLGLRLTPAFVGEATAYLEGWTLDKCEKVAAGTKSPGSEEDFEARTSAVVFDQLTKAVSATTAQDRSLGPPDLQVASELHDHIVAGQDTTAITLTYLCWELSCKPELQAALRKELLTLDRPIKLSEDGKPQKLPPMRVLDGLPLLHAVVMETLRLHTAIPGPQPRTTPNPPVSVAGSPPLPPGIRISSQPYTLHRNADVFPEPWTWRPSRWTDATSEKKAEMAKWFWAFGSGGRMCIGSNIAMQELKLATAAIYSNFNTHVVDDTHIDQIDAYVAPPKGKIMLGFEKL